MTTLALIERPSDATSAAIDARLVVIDAAWSPMPSNQNATRLARISPIRPVLQAILDDVDIVELSLQLLDRWAEDAHLAEAFTVDGTTWWYQARMLLRWDVHELVLWRLVLDRLLSEAPAGVVQVPARRPLLIAAARATRRGSGRSPAIAVADGGALRSALRRGRGMAALLNRGARRWTPEVRRRAAALERRLDRLTGHPGGIVALAWPRAYQVLDRPDGELRADPYLAGPLEVAALAGKQVITIGLGMDHADDRDWNLIQTSPDLLPERFLAERGGPRAILANAGMPGAHAPDVASPAPGIAQAAGIPALLGDIDLGPALSTLVARYGGRWLAHNRHLQRTASATLAALRPHAVFTDREASRTSWLAAARQLGIRSVAIQHGMIYPNSPEYVPGAAMRVRPDVTCVFGEYERDLLLDAGGYRPESVIVTGSARPPDEQAPDEAADRLAVRRQLGIDDRDRFLLVSVAHNELMGELHTFAALARVLGGPLPGIHVVIKLHPQDHAPPRHDRFLRDLATAGGYPAPRTSIVRDVDLYRCLRAADAHLGQHSTVLSDAVVVGTPNMIVVGSARADTLDYVAAGVAVPVRTVDDVRAFMASPTPPSSSARARFLARHFRSGDASRRIAAVLLEPSTRQ